LIKFLTEDIEFPSINTDLLENWIKRIIKEHDYNLGSITIIFCSDQYILKINREFLSHDYFTDIITFDYCENRNISGDLLISLETVRSNSENFNTDFFDELNRVIIHGILHLIGFDDSTPELKANIRKEEDKALEILQNMDV
jgi:rRNA maturation RNase YbeY